MNIYIKVRRAVMVENMSEREAARYFGIHHKTVKKMCQFSAPPGYRCPSSAVSPKLKPFSPSSTPSLDGDKQVHVKQRHTAVRIREWLRDEHGYTGGYTIVRDM